MKRSATPPVLPENPKRANAEASSEVASARDAIECGICFGSFTESVTLTACCKQPIHTACRIRCGASCPYCRSSPPKEWYFAETLIRVEADRGSPAYAKTVVFIDKIRRHLDAIRHDPMHACFHCQTFLRAELILCNRLRGNPENRAVLQTALDRLTAIMPIAR